MIWKLLNLERGESKKVLSALMRRIQNYKNIQCVPQLCSEEGKLYIFEFTKKVIVEKKAPAC